MIQVVCDFDGVIGESQEALWMVFQEVARRRQINLTPEDLRGQSVREVFKKLKIRFWQVPAFLTMGRKIMAENSDKISLHPEFEGFLNDFQRGNIQIISTNSEETIHKLLKREKIDHAFSKVVAEVPLFAKAKRLKAIEGPAVYVGDETRDLLAARKAQMPSIAVTWGLQSEAVLLSERPDFVAKTGKELAVLVTALSAIEKYIGLMNRGSFFRAHEEIEGVWLQAKKHTWTVEKKDLAKQLKFLVLVAGVFEHYKKQNEDGVILTKKRAAQACGEVDLPQYPRCFEQLKRAINKNNGVAPTLSF